MNKPVLKMIFIILCNILPAFFLTKLTDDVTLVTNIQKMFVFSYFLTALILISLMIIKKWKRIAWNLMLTSILVSACFMISAFPRLFIKDAEIQIMPADSNNKDSMGREIWLKDIVIDGDSYGIRQYENCIGWYIDDASGSLVSYGEDITQPLTVKISYRDQVQFVFIMHQWSGKAEINMSRCTVVYDLYAAQGTDCIKTFDYDDLGGTESFHLQDLPAVCGGWILLAQCIYLLCYWAFSKRMGLWAVYLLGICGLWMDGLCETGTLIAAAVLGSVLYNLAQVHSIVRYSKKHITAVGCISLYITFCLIGKETFLYRGRHQTAIIFSTAACFCIVTEILSILDKLRNITAGDRKTGSLKEINTADKIFLVCKNVIISLIFAVMAVLLLDEYVIKQYQACEVEVDALAEHGRFSQNNEVLLDSIRLNGKKVNLSEFVVSYSGGWKEFGEDSYIFNESAERSKLKLSFPSARKIELYFYNYAQAGKACIRDGIQENRVDFSSVDESYSNNFYIYSVTGNVKKEHYFAEYAGYTCLLFFMIFPLIGCQDYFMCKRRGGRRSMKQKYIYWTCWSVIFAGLNIMCAAYFPGNWTWDNLFQWAQATDMVALSDGHPVIMTLFLKMLLKIYKHPAMLLESVIILISVTFAAIYAYLFERGMKQRILYILSVLTVLSPGILIMTVTLLKDSFHMCFMALTVFFCFVLCKTPEYFKRPYYYIGLAASLFFIRQLRHEAIISFLACSAVILLCSLAKRKYFIMGTVVISVIMSLGFDHYTDGLLEKESSTGNAGITLLLNDMSRVLYDGESLTSETAELMQKYMPLESWKTHYDPYDRDAIGFLDEYEQALEENKDIELSDVLKCYITELVYHPGPVIRARLDAVNCMWNISKDKEADIFYGIDGIMTFYCAGPKELGFQADENGRYMADNFMSAIVKPVVQQIKDHQILTDIFLNIGVSIAACLIMLLYLWENDRKLLIMLIPAAVRITTMLLISGWQHYRYYYSIRLMISVSLILLIFNIMHCQNANGTEVTEI